MGPLIAFIGGLAAGSFVGMLVMALAVAARQRHLEEDRTAEFIARLREMSANN